MKERSEGGIYEGQWFAWCSPNQTNDINTISSHLAALFVDPYEMINKLSIILNYDLHIVR
jgi:hypothetical protein